MKKKAQNNLPKQYTVGGQKINIQLVDDLGGSLGRCCIGAGYVKIANTFHEEKQSDTSKSNTLWHEIVHTILDTMGEDELSANEKFVSTFSGFLTEIITTMK